MRLLEVYNRSKPSCINNLFTKKPTKLVGYLGEFSLL